METLIQAVHEIAAVLVIIVTHLIFISVFASWLFAQTLKVFIVLVTKRTFDFKLFVGTGGMPSSHTATVTAASMSVGLDSGFDSAVFMVCLCFSIVVISDALGVRRAAGRQAAVLNRMMDEIGHNRFNSGRLKELLGHTPMEAFAGILIGIIIPVLIF